MSEVRARLKAAIDEFKKQAAKVDNLSSAVDSARRAVDDARTELESYGDLDRQITRFRVAATKRGASPKSLPEDLKAKVDGRKAAESELAQAESTLAALQDELKELRRALRPLEDERTNAAVAVLHQEQGDILAQEYFDVSMRARTLCVLFQGLGQLQIERDGHRKPIGGTQTMTEIGALSNLDVAAVRLMYPDGADVFSDMGERWKSRLGALLNDSEATITRPKLIRPDDYVRTNAAAAFGMPLPPEYKLKPEE